MDCTAAAHRIEVGVPATVEHSSEEGVEAAKWVAETTQVRHPPSPSPLPSPKLTLCVETELHHLHGRTQTQTTSQRSITPSVDGFDERVHEVQGFERVGGETKDSALVRLCVSSRGGCRGGADEGSLRRRRRTGSSPSIRCERARKSPRSSLGR